MYIQREIEREIKPFLNRKEVIAIIGPRQAGKTTLLKRVETNLKKENKSVKYITFEKRSDLDLFQNSVEDFREIAQQYQIVIIDEFQYAQEGGQKLKYLFDTTEVKFIVSGSSSLELTFQTGKYMVGRIFNFTLYPLSFREYLSHVDKELYTLLQKRLPDILAADFKVDNISGKEINQRIEKLFATYLVFGGYPAVVLAKNNDIKQKVLENLLDNYLLKDIKNLLQLATDSELLKLVKFLAIQIGNLISYQELANDAGLNYQAILKHLEILRQTYIIDLIKPFFTNKRTELTKNPKVYFIDSGLRNLSLANFRLDPSREDWGRLVENYVFMALKRRAGFSTSLNFWRTKSKAEVDFVIEKQNKILPVEVKYGWKPTIGKSLHSFIEKFSPPEAIILTRDFAGEKKIKGCEVKFIPVYYLC